jgi:membrane-associated protein
MFLLDVFHWSDLLMPEFYIRNGGLWLLVFIIFAETGLFAGFFLPGDSLLFVAGIFAHELDEKTHAPGLSHQLLNLIGLGNVRNEWLDLLILIGLLSFAGIIGNTLGYWFGKRVGPTMYHWRDRFLFKKRYLYQAKEFYDKHGGMAIVGARFLPLIRTFAPSMILAGHFLQKWVMDLFNFDLKQHLEVIVIGIVLVTTAPVLIKMFFGKKKYPAEPLNRSKP